MLAKSAKKFSATFVVLPMLVLALVLGACGEAPTSTPAPTATPTPAPTPTPVPTTVAATTVAASSQGSSTGDIASLPTISGASEITIDKTIIDTVAQQFGLKSPTVKFYTSDDDASKLADSTDAALIASGYAFSIPGSTKPVSQNGTYAGLYTKANAADVLLAAINVPTDPAQLANQLNIPGVNADTVKGLTDQIKGKKSVLFIVAAPGLLQALFNSLGGASASATDTVTATPTK